MTDVDLDIARLHIAYAEGTDPVEIVDAVYDAIDAAADPGIFITLIEREQATAAVRSLPPFDPVGPAALG